MKEKVSVIIPNYNGYRYLQACLKALNNQTFKDFNIIFVDNASKDESIKYIKDNYEQIKIVELDNNYGFSKAVNEGIKLSDAEYIVLLNNDTEAESDWLMNLVSCIESDNKIFSCSSKMLQFNNRDRIDDAGDEYNILGWAYKRGDNRSIDEFNKSEDIFSTCAGAAIYRRQVFDEIGFFDENFFAYMEDVDLSYRAKIYGYRNVFCSNAVIYHIGSGTSGSKYNSFKVKLAGRNNLYVVFKNMPILQLIINSPFLIIGFLVKYLFFARKGFKEDYKEGFKEAFKQISTLNKTRFSLRHTNNYFKIEALLIKNTFLYILSKF